MDLATFTTDSLFTQVTGGLSASVLALCQLEHTHGGSASTTSSAQGGSDGGESGGSVVAASSTEKGSVGNMVEMMKDMGLGGEGGGQGGLARTLERESVHSGNPTPRGKILDQPK
jgi:hypothetical protein